MTPNSTLKDLKHTWQEMEAEAVALSNERDGKLRDIRAEYDSRIKEAARAAADAQKVYLDHDAAFALLDRPDGASQAKALDKALWEGDSRIQDAARNLGMIFDEDVVEADVVEE